MNAGKDLSSYAGRDLGIDVLRGLSIAAVLAYHYHKAWFPRGNHGVMLFFMISGYCIALSAATARDPWHFWSKRLGRLLPGLMACGAITIAAKQWVKVPPDRYADWSDYGSMLFALPTLNLARVDYRFPDGAYWSLVVEFQFYALVLLLLAVLRKRLLPVLLGCQVLVLVLAAAGGGEVLPVLACYLPSFVAGAACLELHRRGLTCTAVLGMAVAGLALVLAPAVGLSDQSLPVDGGALVAFPVCVGLLIGAEPIGRRFGGAWPMRAIGGLGLVSYPLYLLHQDLGAILLADYGANFTDPSAVLARLVGVPLLMVVLAWATWRLVERPFRSPLTSWLASLPAAVDRIVVGLGGGLLTARGVPMAVSRALVLLAAIALMIVAGRLGAEAEVERAATAVSGLLEAPPAAEAEASQPWGRVALTALPDASVVDVWNVPYVACTRLLDRLQRLEGAIRIAVGTRAVDEQSVPMTRFSRELACVRPGQRVVRLVVARSAALRAEAQ